MLPCAGTRAASSVVAGNASRSDAGCVLQAGGVAARALAQCGASLAGSPAAAGACRPHVRHQGCAQSRRAIMVVLHCTALPADDWEGNGGRRQSHHALLLWGPRALLGVSVSLIGPLQSYPRTVSLYRAPFMRLTRCSRSLEIGWKALLLSTERTASTPAADRPCC